MSAWGFAHPEWLLPLALATGAAWLLLAGAQLRARRRLRRLLGPGAGLRVRRVPGDVALALALGCVALALLGPRIGERRVRVPASGVDVVLLLDVSRSMEAADTPPSRLDRARRAAEALLSRLSEADRAALAVFAGSGVLLTPLTPDHAALVDLLGGIDTALVTPASSDLARGVRAALSAYETGSVRPRVLVVLSDGEDPEAHDPPSAGALTRAGVRVVAAAFGSDAGATLPDHGVPLVDRWGRTVVSRRNAARLAALAEATDGALLRADVWGEIDPAEALAAVRRDAGALPGDVVVRRVPALRVLPFALAAFAILLLEGQPGVRRPRVRALARRRPGPALPIAALVLLALAPLAAGGDAASLPALEAQVRERPDDAASLIALGAARHALGQREAAARAFLAAAVQARAPGAAAVAYHDLGVVALEQGDLEAARAAFLDALALAPDDAQARFNLEWTLRALARPEPPPSRAPKQAPEPSPETAAPPPPTPRPPPAATPRAPAEPPLDAQAQQRLLERIEDDPARALRSATAPLRRRAASRGPVW